MCLRMPCGALFKPIGFVLELKVCMSLPMLRPHFEDVPNKGLINTN